MDVQSFFDLIKQKRFAEAHRRLDDQLVGAKDNELEETNHRKVTTFLAEERYADALDHLLKHRNQCGSITHTHETIALIYEITGRDDLALAELESAPYAEEESVYPLLVADARFYSLFFRAKRKLAVTKAEIDAVPSDYETYLPAYGNMRGVLVTKNDIVEMIRDR